MLSFFRRRQDLRCQQAVEMITDYLDDALPSGQRRRLAAHLIACPHCARYLTQIRTTVAASRNLSPPDIDPADRQMLLELYRNTIHGP